MFQNTNTENVLATDPKISETLATTVFSGAPQFNDVSTLSQYNFEKERLSPIPSWFSGLCQPIANFSNSNNISSSIMSDSITEFSPSGLDNIMDPKSNPGGITSLTKASVTPTTPQPTPPYYTNPLSSPMPNYWGNNFMYPNPAPFAQFFNSLPPFSGNSNSMNPAQMIGPSFRLPNTQFNPFLPPAEIASASFNNGYFPPNFQQQTLLQQQHEHFLALANQQQIPVIKKENETNFTAATPSKEEDKKSEDEHLPSSHTDEESDRLVKPRKSSKCQCPNCTNPLPEDENAKIVKKHACHWPGCPKTYGKTSHLKSHIRQHQGIRPFICPDPTCLKVRSTTIV